MSWRIGVVVLLMIVSCTGCTTYLPIQAVQLSDNDGSDVSPITRQQIGIWVDAANAAYADIGYQFTFDASANSADMVTIRSTVLNSVPSTVAQRESYRALGNFVALIGYPDKIVVFFRARGGGGWSWGPSTTAFVSMPAYGNTCINKPTPGTCNPNDTLLSHELGHYLGLPHTFGPAACNMVALANSDGDFSGQDGSSALGFLADDIRDTAADPGAGCAPTSSLSCPGGEVTVNGVTFDPPWTNIMSYHDCLPETISRDQQIVIGYTLRHRWRNQIPRSR